MAPASGIIEGARQYAVATNSPTAARRVTFFVNEWMAGNTSTLADPSEFPNLAFDDWFELYNPGPDSVQSGIALYEQGKYAEAEATLKDAQGVQANAYRAAALVKQKKYGEAEASAKAAFEADPTHEVAVAVLGEALVNQKKHDEAIDLLSRAIGAKSSLAYAYFWRAQAYQGKKNIRVQLIAGYYPPQLDPTEPARDPDAFLKLVGTLNAKQNQPKHDGKDKEYRD